MGMPIYAGCTWERGRLARLSSARKLAGGTPALHTATSPFAKGEATLTCAPVICLSQSGIESGGSPPRGG